MDFEENVPEIASPILPDIELQKKRKKLRRDIKNYHKDKK